MKLRNLVIFLFLVNPFVLFSQMESDSLLSLMEVDTLSNNEIDSIANTSEIETTINYSARDSIFYDLKTQKLK